MSKASIEDLQQMFDNSLCIYKNKPYYVKGVSAARKARCHNLLTQREEFLPICEESFTAPTQRIGYVNVHGSVVYVKRNPVRRYKTGLTKENLVVHTCQYDYDEGSAVAKNHITKLTSVELADAILGKYPTFLKALETINNGCQIVAFDRQFAVCRRKYIYYKNENVGSLPKKTSSVNDIVFKEGFKHLITLLDGSYETTLSATRS